MARYGQITEVGYGGGFDQAGPWETHPGGAEAYAGSDDENSPGAGLMYPGATETGLAKFAGPMPGQPPDYGGAMGEIVEIPYEEEGPAGAADFSMVGMEAATGEVFDIPKQLVKDLEPDPQLAAEPCGLTLGEFEAYKVQLLADADDARRQKTIHMALAAGAGFVLARYVMR